MRRAMLAVAMTGLLWAKPVVKEGFQVEMPAAWRQLGNSPLTLACVGPVLSGGIPASLNVLVQPEANLDRYLSSTLGQLKAAGSKLLVQKKRRFGNADGVEMVWVDEAGRFRMKYRCAFFCRGGKTYLLTGGANEQDWPQIDPLFRAAVASFRPH